MKACSLFSGIGGFDLGFERAGIETVAQVEFNGQCRELLGKFFPKAGRMGDVRALAALHKRRRLGKPISDDARRFLELIEQCGLICGGFPCQDLSVAGRRAGLAGERSGLWFAFRRVVALFQPAWVVIENVPGLLSSNEGRDFAVVLQGLADLGYGWAYRVLDAQYFGLAQRRERVFVVASFGGRGCDEVLFEREGLCWDSAPGEASGEGVAFSVTAGSRKSDRGEDGNLIAGAVSSKWAKGTGGPAGDECYNLVAHTLRAEAHDASEDGTGSGTPLVVAPAVAFSCKDHAADAGGVSPTLRSMGHDESHANGGGQVAVAFQTRIARNGRGQPKEITDTLTSSDGGSHADSKPHVAYSGGVRRLTPRECERLQGFPDDWTGGFSDSARYRMLGNAVAVPCAEWIGRRLMEVARAMSDTQPLGNAAGGPLMLE